MEDGAWAVPSIKDRYGNFLKENQAPELFIKFIAHDLQCNIIIFDLFNNTVELCSGNHLLDNNVKFDSPLMLYATGSHFQSVLPKDQEFVINYVQQLETRYSVNTSSSNEVNTRTSDIAPDIERLEELKEIEAKERSKAEKRELSKLRQKQFRQQNQDEEKKKMENEKSRVRMRKTREENEESKNVENEKQKERMRKVREDKETRMAENEKQKERMNKVRENKEMRMAENEKQKERMSKVRENKETRMAENEKQKERMSKLRESKEKRIAENEKQKERMSKVRENNPLKNIAVMLRQDDFQESDIADKSKTSYLGSIYDEKNQCVHCEAYRFKNERNFCCSQGDVFIPHIPEPPEALIKLYSNKKFTNNIRGYNNILAMASIGCITPDAIKGPNFKV